VLGFDALGHGGATPVACIEVIAAIVIGIVFIRRQLTMTVPLFAVDLFGEAKFSLATFACYLSFVSQMIAYVALPFAFQTVMGYSPLQVGGLLLPYLLAAAAMAPLSGWLADRYNSSRLAAIGLAIFSVGLLTATFMGSHAAPWDIAWRMALCGIGYGLFQSPNNRSIQGSAPRERAGAAQAIQAVARLVGQTTGAVLVAMVFAAFGRADGSGITEQAVEITMGVATAAAAIGAVASVWRGVLTGAISFAKAS
jgi:MFS transporter, DHA2 family, multidrug resistance protein